RPRDAARLGDHAAPGPHVGQQAEADHDVEGTDRGWQVGEVAHRGPTAPGLAVPGEARSRVRRAAEDDDGGTRPQQRRPELPGTPPDIQDGCAWRNAAQELEGASRLEVEEPGADAAGEPARIVFGRGLDVRLLAVRVRRRGWAGFGAAVRVHGSGSG